MTQPTESSCLLDVLRRAGEEFDQRRLPWALVRGLAVSIRAEPRFTRDVDLAVAVADDAAAEALVGDLRAQGYRLETTLEQEARIEAVGANRGPELAADLERYLAAFVSGPR